MPETKKKSTASSGRGTKKTVARANEKSESTRKKSMPVIEKKPKREKLSPDSKIHQILPFVIFALALFLIFCFVTGERTGLLGGWFKIHFRGLFGGAAYAIPAMLILLSVFWRKQVKSGKLWMFTLFQALFLIFLSSMIHIWTKGASKFSLPAFWNDGEGLVGGGIVGGTVGFILLKLTGSVGAHIIGITALVIFGLFMFGLTPYSIYLYIAYYLHEKKEERMRLEEEDAYDGRPARSRKKPVPEPTEEAYPIVKRDPVDRHHFVPDVEIGDGGASSEEKEETVKEYIPDDDLPPFDVTGGKTETVKPISSTSKITKRKDVLGTSDARSEGNKTDLGAIFTDPEGMDLLEKVADEERKKAIKRNSELGLDSGELEITRTSAVEDQAQETVKKEYQYPPISLLKLDTTPKNVDISEELRTNASRLVETLRSFKVRTRIVNVSRGPAITRYELAPEEGVRVRAIANLVDDIALNLATTGVRIEAPIPGKAAVGIEVPNKSVSTVFLRELVDTETFKKASSKLNVSLGVDVAGAPVFLDISKMPHLLIAGATGMGKSVCINSIITSLLYKASPEEVKLILIDPKKVELNVYNGLPHLLVPVVSDPKKAAGSLHWAVTEMERRFELIEDVGVRDIKNYNNVTKDDPDREFMPHVVIIIDELADLMMTAPDDVEDSICRLAQKARAAGMHLIIGTQRPSVDVITGLIKANVPSRIAFTVSSQTDSRVVLDMAGAEKLIGRGDMLYAPVGAAKPIRVQGAFVSEYEVENIVSFIKEQNAEKVEYSSDIMDSIDRAAAACGSSKKGGAVADGDIDGEGDPMLRSAIELAIDSGKISTSLIQRRLSLGYGRAAKLIDEMEKRGIVSPPEGQKPRSVLITKQQYMEMVLNRNEELE